MNDTKARIRSLWQLTIRLRKVTEAEAWLPPFGTQAAEINKQLDAMCDEVERLIWRLAGTHNPKP